MVAEEEKNRRRPAASDEGGHAAGRQGFGPQDARGTYQYLAKDTNKTEAEVTARLKEENPGWAQIAPKYLTREEAEQLGAPGHDREKRIFMEDARFGLGDPRKDADPRGRPAIKDTKIGYRTANWSEMARNEPSRSLASRLQKRIVMFGVDVTTTSAWIGVRDVAGTNLNEDRFSLGRTDPEKNLRNWADRNDLDSRILFAQADALVQFRRAAEDENNLVFVAGSKLDVVGRLDSAERELVSLSFHIDYAHPTNDPDFRASYVQAVKNFEAITRKVAEELRQREKDEDREPTSPVFTNNRYGPDFAPSDPRLRGYDDLEELRSNSPELWQHTAGKSLQRLISESSRTPSPERAGPADLAASRGAPQPADQVHAEAVSRALAALSIGAEAMRSSDSTAQNPYTHTTAYQSPYGPAYGNPYDPNRSSSPPSRGR